MSARVGSARLPGGRKGPDELPHIVSMAEINNRAASRACIALVSPRGGLQAGAAAESRNAGPRGWNSVGAVSSTY